MNQSGIKSAKQVQHSYSLFLLPHFLVIWNKGTALEFKNFFFELFPHNLSHKIYSAAAGRNK